MLEKHLTDAFLEYLKADRGCSAGTVVSYYEGLRALSDFVETLDGRLRWTSLDADVLRRWIVAETERGMQPRTVGRELCAVRAFYRYLLLVGKTTKNPTVGVRAPKADRHLPVFYKEKEMNRLFDEVDFGDDYLGRRNRLIMLVFYTTGLRVSELCGLNVDDVDLSGGELKVTGKRNKQRIVPFGGELRENLRNFLPLRAAFVADDSPRPYVPVACVTPETHRALFLSRRKRRMTPQQVRAVVKHCLTGVTTQRKRNPHSLRHTFATVMLNNGADLEAVKELLGHKSITTTEIYTHTSLADLKNAYMQAHPHAED